MGQKMSNAPIYYALAQARFNAVLALEQYLPAIQDNLRKVGFPDYEKSFLGVINVTIGAPSQSPSVPQMQPQARYSFRDEAGTSGFLLDQAMMLFQTTAYDTFEAFSGEFIKGLKALHDVAGLTYSERVGVRCLDAVVPKEGETLDKYLAPSVMGIYDKLAPRQLIHGFSETRTKAGNTTLLSRAVILNQDAEGPVAFSPELLPVQVKLIEKFTKVKGLHGVVDTDCWLDEREKFDLSGLGKRLLALHGELRRSFDLMVTPHALEVWQ